MPRQLSKRYEPTEVEVRWRQAWDESGLTRAKADGTEGQAFCIMMPPPNVTGSLHMGHGLNHTLQDAMTRYQRMLGKNVLWLPGTDHAGIATQWVVRNKLEQQGVDIRDLGREQFVEEVWKWRAQSGRTIVEQLQRLGVSCDWSRERFTMDEGLSRAVREAFVRLYEDGLIYRSEWLINWCPSCGTALSDLEVEHEDLRGSFWHLRYPLVDDEDRALVVATTRPETMLGDTAVAVHPSDERYSDLLGKHVHLPLAGRTIPIIADEHADPEKGTGAVKITPAHDFNDFEVGNRHDLPRVNILTPRGHISADIDGYAGLTVDEARKAVVKDLEAGGYLVQVEDRDMSVGRCYRCRTVAEPFLSLQWFVKTEPLAKPALEAVADGRVRLVPDLWVSTWNHWLGDIRDWCISRQIWWGHRIPAWTCQGCGELIVAKEDPSNCGSCGGSELVQDPDVLDTWFSSGLWPFSTLGWPEETPELETFYPTSVLFTDADILFFWVARMVMSGLYFMGDVPYADVYLHSLITDEDGDKMSKTRGNVIDPLELMDHFGTDALRLALTASLSEGRNVRMSAQRVEGFRNFVNKLWNAARFVLMNLEPTDAPMSRPELDAEREEMTLADRWILARCSQASEDMNQALSSYRFGDYGMGVYHFVWDVFCDWYLEWVKPLLRDGEESARVRSRRVMLTVLESLTRLLHPVVPFVTEEIRSALPNVEGLAMGAPFPKGEDFPVDDEALVEGRFVMDAVGALRRMRGDLGVPNHAKPQAVAVVGNEAEQRILEHCGDAVVALARLTGLEIGGAPAADRLAAQAPVASGALWLLLDGVLDLPAERERLSKEQARLEKERRRTEGKLANPSFVERAPAEIVDKQRRILDELNEHMDKNRAALARLDALEARS
jgi:valyl-tRNA synthetase